LPMKKNAFLLLLALNILLVNAEEDYEYDDYDAEPLELLPEHQPLQHTSEGIESDALAERTHHEEMTKLHEFVKQRAISNDHPPPMPITIDFSGIRVVNILLDEHSQTLSAKLTLCSYHVDERLRWDPKEFNGTKIIVIPRWEVWTPYFIPMNSIDNLKDNNFFGHYVNAIIYNVNFVGPATCPALQVTVDCEIDASEFPFDMQLCTIVMYDKTFGRDFEYKLEQGIDLFRGDYYDNVTKYSNWHMRSKLATWASVDANMRELVWNDPNRETNAVRIHILLERHSPYYVTIFLCPAFLITTLSSIAFLHPNRRIVLLTISSNLMLLMIFIISSSKNLPTNFKKRPRIFDFWRNEVVISSIQLTACIVIIVTRHLMKNNDILGSSRFSSIVISYCRLLSLAVSLGNLYYLLHP
ncbi:hypothetical protein PFISCL1PPCAC_20909, partial [Pristionchus fissidentatus]